MTNLNTTHTTVRTVAYAALALVSLFAITGCARLEAEVEAISPAHEAEVTPGHNTVTVYFGDWMDEDTIHAGTFSLRTASGTRVPGTVTTTRGGTAARYTADSSLPRGAQLTVQLTDNVLTLDGRQLKPFKSTFTVADVPLFELLSLNPDIEQVGASNSTTIVATFTAPISPLSVRDGAVSVSGDRSGSREVELSLVGGNPSNQLEITVDRGFVAGEVVQVALTPILRSTDNVRGAKTQVRFTVASGTASIPGSLRKTINEPVHEVVLADVDGDLKEEALIVYEDGKVELANGSFSSVALSSFAENVEDLAAGDFNGDGSVDIVVVPMESLELQLFLGNNGAFSTEPQRINLPVTDEDIEIGALHANADGVMDLLVCIGPVSTQVHFGDDVNPLADSTVLPEVALGRVASADFNGDDLPDLAVPNNGSIRLLFGDGLGGFERGVLLTGSTPYVAALAASLDGDDVCDIVAVGEAYGVAYLANGLGAFSSEPLESGAGVRGAAVADMTGDAKLDVISPEANLMVALDTGRGDGLFDYASSGESNAAVVDIRAGDLNGDGRLDLVLKTESGLQIRYGQ